MRGTTSRPLVQDFVRLARNMRLLISATNLRKIFYTAKFYKPFFSELSTLIQKRVQWISIHFNM